MNIILKTSISKLFLLSIFALTNFASASLGGYSSEYLREVVQVLESPRPKVDKDFIKWISFSIATSGRTDDNGFAYLKLMNSRAIESFYNRSNVDVPRGLQEVMESWSDLQNQEIRFELKVGDGGMSDWAKSYTLQIVVARSPRDVIQVGGLTPQEYDRLKASFESVRRKENNLRPGTRVRGGGLRGIR